MTALSSPESRRIRLISDGVVASYIHDISARTTPGAASAEDRQSSAEDRRHGSPATRLARTRRALRDHDAHNRRLSA
jgi:hypothetical protein